MPAHNLASKPDLPKLPKPLGKDALYLVLLLTLAALTAFLWYADPSHLPQGKSRVDWPSQSVDKP